MTLINATNLNDQVDYLSANHSFADQTLDAIFNTSPRNIVEDDDDDDLDQTLPDPDEDDLNADDNADDDDAFPDDLDDDDDDLDADTYSGDADELDKLDDSEDAGVTDRETNNDDDKGSVSTPFTKPSSFADRPTGRTTGRMIDHEPGSPNNL